MEHLWDAVWFNAKIATMALNEDDWGLINSGAVGIQAGRIAWIGPVDAVPSGALSASREQRDCGGRLITPGLVDCHTHLIYGGNRAREFEMRLNGASYQEIARAGGGINATVQATRRASENELYEQALPRLERLMSDGVTTVEIKSGYGLNTETELKMLRVARRLRQDLPINVKTTFLGAHALPPEYSGRADDYITLVCKEMLPQVVAEELADAVDAFCEGIGFTPAQVERVFIAAKDHGLALKCHAEQLSNLRGAVLAARYGAVSVDHLEYLHDRDVEEIAQAGVTAVLLPGAFYFLGETKRPPVAALRKHNVAMALATDSNPGSSPVLSLTLMLNMACTLFNLTPNEALGGVTRNGARALKLEQSLGTLQVGKWADLVLWDVSDPAELSYTIGAAPCRAVMYEGKVR